MLPYSLRHLASGIRYLALRISNFAKAFRIFAFIVIIVIITIIIKTLILLLFFLACIVSCLGPSVLPRFFACFPPLPLTHLRHLSRTSHPVKPPLRLRFQTIQRSFGYHRCRRRLVSHPNLYTCVLAAIDIVVSLGIFTVRGGQLSRADRPEYQRSLVFRPPLPL